MEIWVAAERAKGRPDRELTLGNFQREMWLQKRRAPREMITQTAILKRGWTMLQIDKYLGLPDARKRNRRFRKGAPKLRLYILSKVKAVEATEAFMAEATARRAARVVKYKAALGLPEETGP